MVFWSFIVAICPHQASESEKKYCYLSQLTALPVNMIVKKQASILCLLLFTLLQKQSQCKTTPFLFVLTVRNNCLVGSM